MQAGFRHGVLIAAVMCASPAWAVHDVVIVTNQPVAAGAGPIAFLNSRPGSGEALSKSPRGVTLTFSKPVDGVHSSMRVIDTYSSEMQQGSATADGRRLSVKL